MGEAAFQPGDRVAITRGAFAGMPGKVLSPAEVAARWPGTQPVPEVERGEAFWVVVQVFGRDIPVSLYADWIA